METLLPRAKEAAAAFSGLAAIAYACGYLALRGRARALGTDPLLGLFEEAYVFAGFRFVLVTLLALLVGLPVIVLIRHLAGAVVSRLGGSSWLDWLALTAFAFLVMLQFVFALGVQGLLLAGEPSHGWLAAAALGENAGGALATVVLTIVAALLVQWCMHLLPHASLSHLGAALDVWSPRCRSCCFPSYTACSLLTGLCASSWWRRVAPRALSRRSRLSTGRKIVLHCSLAVPPAGANW